MNFSDKLDWLHDHGELDTIRKSAIGNYTIQWNAAGGRISAGFGTSHYEMYSSLYDNIKEDTFTCCTLLEYDDGTS